MKRIAGSSLVAKDRRKRAQSCGCLALENFKKRSTVHELSGHPLYRTWMNMMDRCYNPKAKAYSCYGARGIRVCKEWKKLKGFITGVEKEIGPRPDPAKSLDRILVDGNYEPGNVRWASSVEQAINRRVSVRIKVGDKFLTRAEYARSLGIAVGALSQRMVHHPERYIVKRLDEIQAMSKAAKRKGSLRKAS
jgi:hypothetical protein